jgi:hypothetical protein
VEPLPLIIQTIAVGVALFGVVSVPVLSIALYVANRRNAQLKDMDLRLTAVALESSNTALDVAALKTEQRHTDGVRQAVDALRESVAQRLDALNREIGELRALVKRHSSSDRMPAVPSPKTRLTR